jgi:ubiquinone biosynthesis protein
LHADSLHRIFKQVFNYGFFHADPHPGNIFILPDNIVCFLDFGLMGNILHKDVEQLGNLFLSVTSMDVRKIIRAFQLLSDNPSIKDFRAH